MDAELRLRDALRKLAFRFGPAEMLGRRCLFEERGGDRAVLLFHIAGVHIADGSALTILSSAPRLKGKLLVSFAVNPAQDDDVAKTQEWHVQAFYRNHRGGESHMRGKIRFI